MAIALPELFGTRSVAGGPPRFKLEKGAGAAAGGFGGGLLAAAAGALGVVGVAQADPLSDALSTLQMQLVAAPGLSTCNLRFLPRADFPPLAPGDAITVKLGAGAAPLAVFAGTVAKLSGGGGVLDVLLAAPAAKLARIRRNAGYENQGFADLLQAWAGEAGIGSGQVDSGPDYAFLAIDDRLSLWDWVARLARHADLPAWTDAQGALNAHPPGGPPVATFRYGQTVLALDAQSRDPVTSSARIVGEGSAGRQGSDAWSWLAKDPRGISAGAGGVVEQDGALRGLAAVAGAALGVAAAAARVADRVELRVPGTPVLDVASVFALENCPGGAGDGSWSAVEVRHRLSAGGGFVTELVGVKLP